MKRWFFGLIIFLPFLLGTYCNLQTRFETVLKRTPRSPAAEEVIADFLKVTPFATFTPTPTPTLTPTVTITLPVQLLPGGQDPPPIDDGGVDAASTGGVFPPP